MELRDIQKHEFVVGMKETIRSLEKGEICSVFVASDCEPRIVSRIMEACAEAKVPVIQDYTKKEIGVACGIKVKAATAAVLKSR